MEYVAITEQDYVDHFGEKAPDNFKSLLERTTTIVNVVTRGLIHTAVTQERKFQPHVALALKDACLLQVAFMHKSGATTVEELNNQPTTVRMGETTVSNARTSGGAAEERRQSALSSDAREVLEAAGLLYRGASGVMGDAQSAQNIFK